MKNNQAVVKNMQFGISAHLIRVCPIHTLMAKDIVCTMASSQSDGRIREIAKALGVDRQNI